MYDVPLAFQCIYGCSDEVGEDEDGRDRSEVNGEEERVKINWPLV